MISSPFNWFLSRISLTNVICVQKPWTGYTHKIPEKSWQNTFKKDEKRTSSLEIWQALKSKTLRKWKILHLTSCGKLKSLYSELYLEKRPWFLLSCDTQTLFHVQNYWKYWIKLPLDYVNKDFCSHLCPHLRIVYYVCADCLNVFETAKSKIHFKHFR